MNEASPGGHSIDDVYDALYDPAEQQTAIAAVLDVRHHVCDCPQDDGNWTNWFEKLWNTLKNIPGDIANIPGHLVDALKKAAVGVIGEIIRIVGDLVKIGGEVAEYVENMVRSVGMAQAAVADDGRLSAGERFMQDMAGLDDLVTAANGVASRHGLAIRVPVLSGTLETVSTYLSPIEHLFVAFLQKAVPEYGDMMKDLTVRLGRIAASDDATTARQDVIIARGIIQGLIAVSEAISTFGPRDSTASASAAGEGGGGTIGSSTCAKCWAIVIMIFKIIEAILTGVLLSIDSASNLAGSDDATAERSRTRLSS